MKATPSNPIKYLFSLFMLTLALSLSNTALADSSKLTGHWIGGKINITIKADHTYQYKILKIINVSGDWTATNSQLVLNYTTFGSKKKKTASYHFKGKDLILKMKGKKAVTLKKQ